MYNIIMAMKSVGKREKQRAEARKFMGGVDRHMEILALGTGIDMNIATGKPLGMGQSRRITRTEKKSHHTNKLDSSNQVTTDFLGNEKPDEMPWDEVTSMSLIGFIYGDNDADSINDRIDLIRSHIPELFDIHEDNVFDKLLALSVPAKYSSLFEQLVAEQEAHQKHLTNSHHVTTA